MKIRKTILAVCAVVITVTAVSAQETRVAMPGLANSVSVRRDARWIPYIEAANDADAYFVQGYVTASDRLWQMDLMRRVARGETAEIFGNTTFEEDKRWRRFRFAEVADESLKYLNLELKAALESYSRGVNAYIASLNDASMPIEFKILQYKPRDWTAADSVVIGKILADALSTTWRADLARAAAQALPKEKLQDLSNQVTPYDVVLFGKDVRRTEEAGGSVAHVDAALLRRADAIDEIRTRSLSRIGLYAEDLAASNNWVISGKRTADGKPLLANDPHLLPTAPGIWYLTHLSTPTMRVSGVTFPGVPGIVLGHNEHIAWGATNVGPDVQDLYEEQIGKSEPSGAETYATTEGQKPVEKHTTTILVRNSPLTPGATARSFEFRSTRNGPIILEQAGKSYSLRWTAFDPKNSEFEAFYFLNRAKGWGEFKNALKTYGGATQNFVYADVKGNIGWYAAGRIPIRRAGDGSLPYNGATNEGDWIGSIPFEELPNLYNPPEGLIVTANQRIVGTSYRYQQISRDAAPPWRARRIYDLLKDNTKATIEDMTRVQLDSYNIPLANLAKEIVAQNGASAETIELLKGWDGNMTPESRAALLVNEIRLCLAEKMVGPTQVPISAIRERVLGWAIRERSARWLPAQYEDYPSLMRGCDAQANAALMKRLGPDTARWTWSTTSQSRFPHPLAVAPLIGAQFATPAVGISGSGQTPNVASFVSMRHVASPGNWDATRHVIPLGQSGDPKSPHFKDQFDLWRTGAPAVFPFTKAAVESAAKLDRVFEPKK